MFSKKIKITSFDTKKNSNKKLKRLFSEILQKKDPLCKVIDTFSNNYQYSYNKKIITKFKKSVANFKTRKGSNAGLKVTLRKNKMYEFLDRLVNIALPRIKDFRGLSKKGFDKFGNYTFGIKEHIIFPEVSFDRADKVRGLDIVVVISSKNKDHSFALLEKLNFPFIKKGDN